MENTLVKNTVPMGVKLIPILNWIVVLSFLTLAIRIGGYRLWNYISLLSIVFVISIILSLCGLWMGRKFVRITTIILSFSISLLTFFYLLDMMYKLYRGIKFMPGFTGYLVLIVLYLLANLSIACYLSFNPKVREYFSQKQNSVPGTQ